MIKRRLCTWCSDVYRLILVFGQLMYGIWRLSTLEKPIVSIFGGSRFVQTDIYAQKANDLAHSFVREGISVLTGGGPGIMEAASCGAIRPAGVVGKSIGIGVKGLQEGPNVCVQEYFELDYFFARKWLLIHYSQGFVVFPGGFGTFDELAEVLTLMQLRKISQVPIVLVGKEFWQPFMDWLSQEVIKHELIMQKDVQLFIITDDLQEVFNVIKKVCVLKESV